LRLGAAQPCLPDELHALGRVLDRVLSAEHDPDLSGLPPQLADAVRGMLAGLGTSSFVHRPASVVGHCIPHPSVI
jgi:hypothetical protein